LPALNILPPALGSISLILGHINYLSTIYQLFINYLSTIYQLFINYLTDPGLGYQDPMKLGLDGALFEYLFYKNKVSDIPMYIRPPLSNFV
jgi:hypothetical protein